jgi:hypothetical protein
MKNNTRTKRLFKKDFMRCERKMIDQSVYKSGRYFFGSTEKMMS